MRRTAAILALAACCGCQADHAAPQIGEGSGSAVGGAAAPASELLCPDMRR